jgi:5'-methylthioadenosine phosphorylase
MTALPEAKLAREAEICYGMMAVVTDYDCWNELSETVSADMVISNLKKTIEVARKALRHAIVNMPAKRECSCGHSLENAIITDPALIPDAVKNNLDIIIGKYVK